MMRLRQTWEKMSSIVFALGLPHIKGMYRTCINLQDLHPSSRLVEPLSPWPKLPQLLHTSLHSLVGKLLRIKLWWIGWQMLTQCCHKLFYGIFIWFYMYLYTVDGCSSSYCFAPCLPIPVWTNFDGEEESTLCSTLTCSCSMRQYYVSNVGVGLIKPPN